MALPVLTPEEKLNGLKKAQEMRSQRAELRLLLKQGKLTLKDILQRSEDEVVGRMRVSYLLESLPQVGKITSQKIMSEIGINENRRIQGLGQRQRDELLKRFA